MKTPILVTLIVCAPLALAEADERLDAARTLTQSTQQTLGATLKQALQTGGPVAAIDKCHVAAPEITASAATASGMQIGRTALRVRNAANRASVFQAQQMQGFEQQLRAGFEGVPESYIASEDGSHVYMRAIVTQPMCLTCHGEALTPEVSRALERLYPTDEATGFRVGELRGAWVVSWRD